MRNPRMARIVAGVIMAALVPGTAATANATTTGGTPVATICPGAGGSIGTTPSVDTSVPATPPSTDTTGWVCPGPGGSIGTTPSVPTSDAPWPMPYPGGPGVSQGTTITIGCNVRGVTMPRVFVLSGVLGSGTIGGPALVQVMKPGTSRWSYSSMRLVYSANGDWWYRYTPKMRGTYRFRAVPGAPTAAVGSAMSRTILVSVK